MSGRLGCTEKQGKISPERKRDIRYNFDSLLTSPPYNNVYHGLPRAPSRAPGRRDAAGDGFHGEQWIPDHGCGGIPDGLRDASCGAEGSFSVAIMGCFYSASLRGQFINGLSLGPLKLWLPCRQRWCIMANNGKANITRYPVFLVIFTLACIGTLIFQCIPVSAAWDFAQRPPPFGTGNATCYSISVFTAIGLFNGSVNIATDVAFALLPIPIIWKLNVNIRTKITLILILSLGFMACAAAIVREVLLSTFFEQTDENFHNAYALWNYAELCVGIIAACLPALRPLFAFLLDKASSTFASGQPGLSTRHKYYMQSNDINLSAVGKKGGDSETPRGDGRYGVSVTSNGRDFYEERMPRRPMGKLEQSLTEGEGDSDENILPIQDVERHANNRIVKTTEVLVT
ncbi:hypothetical protein V499_05718 [Pseudogymnoascus sp. VKM F-103]|nr:hypothetical protein V499_05718 [Pseudogymnoascus sp. VKM F-103]